MLVANRRFGLSEPFVLARGVRRATGRRVRFLGIPDDFEYMDAALVDLLITRVGRFLRR